MQLWLLSSLVLALVVDKSHQIVEVKTAVFVDQDILTLVSLVAD